MRFADVAKGVRATLRVELPLGGDAKVEVLVRPMSGLEVGRAVAEARAYASAEARRARRPGDEREPPEPKEGDRLYDIGYMVATLLVACEDPENPGTPFFGGAEEVLGLDADRIALLYEEQQAWQDRCSPRPLSMGRDEFMATTFVLAGEDEGQPASPFQRLRPTLQLSWARTIARLYTLSPTPKSPGGSTSGKTDGG